MHRENVRKEEGKLYIAWEIFHRKGNTHSRFVLAWHNTLLEKSLNAIPPSPHAKQGLMIKLSVMTCLYYFVYQADKDSPALACKIKWIPTTQHSSQILLHNIAALFWKLTSFNNI